ncbi:SagB/ThcOx family dehydrogenase [Candidatus Roizmanbacteria bacterium]|nr:MAG: SagB/ThcOx family dehydrogenase [Candidatus Roizmanbacteria bacterium]
MKKIDIKELTQTRSHAYQRFHKKTILSSIPQFEFMPDELPEAATKTYYKSYPRFPEIKLPTPDMKLGKLSESFEQRTSSRTFSNKPVSMKQLSTLLHFSAGEHNKNKRFYPSGGARYGLETYLISTNTSLENGVYHYYVPGHSLEKLLSIDTVDFHKAFTPYNQTWAKNMGFMIVMTAVIDRIFIKYGERSYRFAHIEAGHMGQNMYLISNQISLNCCGAAGIVDTYFEKVLDINLEKEPIIYTVIFGSIG